MRKYKHIARAIYGKQPTPKFKLGDLVSIHGTDMNGKISHVGDYDAELGQRRYKVSDSSGGRKTWNEKSLLKKRKPRAIKRGKKPTWSNMLGPLPKTLK